ncbi:MAG: UDP-2,3-diacylglucosamine diphosphatase [Mariniphaga sp.]
MNRSKKIYFASDVHLGAAALKHNRERELMFVNWLHQIREDAEMIVLLGDIFDFWFEYRKVVPKGFVRFLGEIASICDSGIPVHFFAGNHDIWVFDYLTSETGMIIHTEPWETELFGKKFFLAHGDDLGKTDKKYQFLQAIFRNKLAQWAFAKIHPDLAFRWAHNWSKSSRLGRGAVKVPFLGEQHEHQIIFAKEVLKKRFFDFFVLGHRHAVIDFQLSEISKIFVLSEWFSDTIFYGVYDGNTFRLEKIDNKTLFEK